MPGTPTVPDPAFAPLLIGQVVEWLVWGELVSRSGGDLRVFLPTRDMGIDGVVLRHSTEQMVPVQVKGRSRLEAGILRVHVQEHDVSDPHAVVVVAVVDLATNALREPVFVMSSAELRERARLISWGGHPAFAIEIPYPPGSVTHWAPLACGLGELPQRLAPGPHALAWAEESGPPAVPEAADQEALATTGYLGEMALLHHAALSPQLNVFHAAPDTGFVEYVVRNVATNALRGYQVKCVELGVHARHQVHIPRHTLSTSPENRLLVFVREHGGDVVSPCLLLPASDIPGLAHDAGDGRLVLLVDPEHLGRLAPYAVKLADLPARLADY